MNQGPAQLLQGLCVSAALRAFIGACAVRRVGLRVRCTEIAR